MANDRYVEIDSILLRPPTGCYRPAASKDATFISLHHQRAGGVIHGRLDR
jgi:hypothetical protein